MGGKDIAYLAEIAPRSYTRLQHGQRKHLCPKLMSQISQQFPEGVLTNPLCFGVAFANTLTTSLSIVDTVVQDLLLPVQNLLDCKTIPSINKSVLEACPVYSLYSSRPSNT